MEEGASKNSEIGENMPKKTLGSKNKITLIVAAIAIFGLGVMAGNNGLRYKNVATTSNGAPSSLNYSSVNQIYDILKSSFDGNLNQNKLLDGLKEGLAASTGDPYTEYFNPADAKSLNEQLSGSFTGIGAELGTDDANNIIIVSPLDGLPAQQAGLKSRDQIVAIDGQSTAGISVTTAVQKIRGPANTKITLTIVRAGGNPFDVPITRSQITVPSVKTEINGNIGYIKITQFTNDTVQLAQQAASDFKAKGVKGVVLDLRGNPGGYLQGAIDISSMWLDRGKVVVMEKKDGKVINTDYSTGDDSFAGLPTVVLIDGGSASASEITAGALHDNGVAALVGEKSFGKGSVQQVKDLSDGSELKVTIAHWYTPNNKNINKQGIKPDTEIKLTDDDSKAGRDPQKDKAFQIIQDKIPQ
jgi:carboxyl-terminal processing protease